MVVYLYVRGGLTHCPLVNGDRRKNKSFFLCFILIIKKYKAFFFLTISLWTIERPAQYSAWFLPHQGRGLHHSHYLRDDKKKYKEIMGGKEENNKKKN